MLAEILQTYWYHRRSLHCLKKNAPTLASCSIDKHGLILIIFGKQHQHTFTNDMHIQLSLSVHFYLLYLHMEIAADGNDAKQRVFLARLLGALERAGCTVVQCVSCDKCRFQFTRCSKWCAFSLMHAHNRFLHIPTASTVCHMLANVIDALYQVASVAYVRLLQCTHIPASVAKFCSRPGFRVNQTVWWTQIWIDKIQCFLLKEMDYFTSIEWRQRHFRRSYLKANKVSKNNETRKVEYAYHFWKCVDAVYQKLVHDCRNYSLPKFVRFLRHSVEMVTPKISINNRQKFHHDVRTVKSVLCIYEKWSNTFYEMLQMWQSSCVLNCRSRDTRPRYIVIAKPILKQWPSGPTHLNTVKYCLDMRQCFRLPSLQNSNNAIYSTINETLTTVFPIGKRFSCGHSQKCSVTRSKTNDQQVRYL